VEVNQLTDLNVSAFSKREYYLDKVASDAKRLFIASDAQVHLEGIVVAGSGSLKNQLVSDGYLDKRLQSKIMKVTDIASGGRNGLILAIGESKDLFAGTKMMKDQQIVQNLMQMLALEEDKVVVGVKEVYKALHCGGAVERVILAKELNESAGAAVVSWFEKIEEKQPGGEDESILKVLLSKAEEVGAQVDVVEIVTVETHVFVKGLGGAAAILRYPLPIDFFADEETQKQEFELENHEDDLGDVDSDMEFIC
jgi:peptide subunit release factor 1 (eRF1)